MNEARGRRRTELYTKIEDTLSDVQVERVHDYVDALNRPMSEWVNPDSNLVTTKWLEEFRSRLQAHHSINIEPLTKTTFEDAFAASCTADKRRVTKSTSATNRFWDIKVDAESISLKTTAAQNLSPKYAKISKLTEAAWIQDQRSPVTRRLKTIELVHEFRSNVDSIIMLRAFRYTSGAPRRYELLEVPGRLFDSIAQAPKEAFAADGPRVDLPYGSAEPDMVLKIDRSDAKVTLDRIRIASCIVHAVWELPIDLGTLDESGRAAGSGA